MSGRLAGFALCALLLAGCGRVRPTKFSETGRGLATQLKQAMRTQDAKAVDRILEVVDQRREQKKINDREHAVFIAVKDDIAAGNWDSAKQIIEQSLELGGLRARKQ